jgi:hypothetical protein
MTMKPMFPSARADKSLFIAYGLHPGTRIAALTTDAEMVNLYQSRKV